MNVLVYALLFLLAAWLIYVGRYSGRLKAQRTRLIQAPLPAVFAAIADLGEWAHWCPWLDPESTQPGPTLTPSAQAVLAWRNPLHGQGEIRTLRQTPGQRIVQQGRWSLPFAVKGTLVWNLVERGDHDGRMAQQGIYAKLVRLQFEAETSSD